MSKMVATSYLLLFKFKSIKRKYNFKCSSSVILSRFQVLSGPIEPVGTTLDGADRKHWHRLFIKALITNYQKRMAYSKRNPSSPSSGGSKSEIRVSAGPCPIWKFWERVCSMTVSASGAASSPQRPARHTYHSILCFHLHMAFFPVYLQILFSL